MTTEIEFLDQLTFNENLLKEEYQMVQDRIKELKSKGEMK